MNVENVQLLSLDTLDIITSSVLPLACCCCLLFPFCKVHKKIAEFDINDKQFGIWGKVNCIICFIKIATKKYSFWGDPVHLGMRQEGISIGELKLITNMGMFWF